MFSREVAKGFKKRFRGEGTSAVTKRLVCHWGRKRLGRNELSPRTPPSACLPPTAVKSWPRGM